MKLYTSMGTATMAWRTLLNTLLTRGEDVSPRGLPTKEMIGVTTRFNMRDPVVSVAKRKLGLRFMAAEAAWILSGDNRVSTIKPYSREIERFSDDGVWFAGAYGPPLRDQLPYLVKTLCDDPFSRQAVATIWRPRPGSSLDVPCTISVQLMLRHGAGDPAGTLRMHVIVNMRSSDAWLGWPYDVFNFSCLGFYVAAHVMKKTVPIIKPGTLTLNAGSQHLYERNFEGAKACLDLVDVPYATDEINLEQLVNNPDVLIEHLWNLAAISSHGWASGSYTEPFVMTWLVDMFHDRYTAEDE